MRRNLLMISALGSMLVFQQPAYSLGLPVIDVASITQLLNQIEQMKQENQTTLATLGSLLKSVDPNNIASGIIGQQPLPSMPNISSIIQGSNGSVTGALSQLANQFKNSNTFYTPQSTGSSDFTAMLMQRNGNTLSGIQGMLAQQIDAVQTNITNL